MKIWKVVLACFEGRDIFLLSGNREQSIIHEWVSILQEVNFYHDQGVQQTL